MRRRRFTEKTQKGNETYDPKAKLSNAPKGILATLGGFVAMCVIIIFLDFSQRAQLQNEKNESTEDWVSKFTKLHDVTSKTKISKTFESKGDFFEV